MNDTPVRGRTRNTQTKIRRECTVTLRIQCTSTINRDTLSSVVIRHAAAGCVKIIFIVPEIGLFGDITFPALIGAHGKGRKFLVLTTNQVQGFVTPGLTVGFATLNACRVMVRHVVVRVAPTLVQFNTTTGRIETQITAIIAGPVQTPSNQRWVGVDGTGRSVNARVVLLGVQTFLTKWITVQVRGTTALAHVLVA